METLSKKSCLPCQKGTVPLQGEILQNFYKQLDPSWLLIEEKYLEKTYTFANFKDALAFTNQIGNLAEQEGHHPDLWLSWGKVQVRLWTHKINGLSENDFILAAKCDAIQQ